MIRVAAFTVALLAIAAGPTRATERFESAPAIAGVHSPCRDIRGVEVVTYKVVNLGDVGFARRVNRIPIIMIDPHILAGLPPKLQLFFYLHECGHHALGHWDIRPASAESDADCWAITRARDWGELLRTEVEQFEPFLARSNGSPFGHLAGPARERHLLQCYDER